MTHALIFVAILLLAGVLLREVFPLFRWLFIPASVVAGLLGLVVVQVGIGVDNSLVVDWAKGTSDVLSGWPGWLIAVVFAGMLLIPNAKPTGNRVRRVGQEGLMVWIIVLGQTAIGLLATWLIVQRFYEVPTSFGMLIETGFAGGHGTAAAMGEVFAHPTVNLAAGKDLGMLMATCGLVYGVVTGILWINVGVRRGWASKPDPSGDSVDADLIEGESSRPKYSFGPIGIARVNRETVDPLLFQMALLALAFGIGWLMQKGVMGLAGYLDGLSEVQEVDAAREQLSKRLSISNVVDFPLFIYTLFGGLMVQKVLRAFGQVDRIDAASISRLSATAMDILVVAAIASLNLQAVVAMFVPFSVLLICGGIWTAVCLMVIGRWILPKEYWFQLGLINYGMSTGTTATGFVLLRMVDPDLKSGAAEDYALAAPISAPFVGGGMITIALPLLLLERIPIAVSALAIAAIVVAMILIGRKLFLGKE